MEKKRTFMYPTDQQLFYMALAFFVFMMLFNLTHSSLWGDEWVEYHYSQRGIMSGDLYRSITSTYQPPLYNFIMHFWLKVGKTILWFRLFNVICGTIAGISVYSTVKRITNINYAIGVLVTFGATYQWVRCIQECSEYALMLMFLCLAFYFYVRECQEHRLSLEISFILSCIGAMYSQYGAFFIVAPLLMMQVIGKIIFRDNKKIIRTIALYVFSFLFFAVPLYVFFAKVQMKNNQISENSQIMLSWKKIQELPLVFGRLIGYFLDLNRITVVNQVMTVIGMIILLIGISMLIKRSISWVTKSLVIVLLLAYTLFYWLVTFHIYAMVHPDQSAGYYSRYALFFIPAFYVIIPLMIYTSISWIKSMSLKKWTVRAISCSVGFFLFLAYPRLLDNWHKTYDKELAEIWVYNAGFDDTTYLIGGTAKEAFEYHTKQYNYRSNGEVFPSSDIDLDNLPDTFWLWRFNWSGDLWRMTIDAAAEQGYKIVIYADYGDGGQLAYCTK